MKTKLLLLPILAIAIIFLLTTIVLGQPPGLPGNPEQAPLGGLAVLAAAGGAYAVKKLRDRNRN